MVHRNKCLIYSRDCTSIKTVLPFVYPCFDGSVVSTRGQRVKQQGSRVKKCPYSFLRHLERYLAFAISSREGKGKPVMFCAVFKILWICTAKHPVCHTDTEHTSMLSMVK